MKHLGYNLLGFACGWVALKINDRIKSFKEGYRKGRTPNVNSDLEKNILTILRTLPEHRHTPSLVIAIKEHRSLRNSSLLEAKNYVDSLIATHHLNRIEENGCSFYK